MDTATLDWAKLVLEDVVGVVIPIGVTCIVYIGKQFVDSRIANIKDDKVKAALLAAEAKAQQLLENGGALAYAHFAKTIDSVHDVDTRNETFNNIANQILVQGKDALTAAGYGDPATVAAGVKAELFKLLAADPNFSISTSSNSPAVTIVAAPTSSVLTPTAHPTPLPNPPPVTTPPGFVPAPLPTGLVPPHGSNAVEVEEKPKT